MRKGSKGRLFAVLILDIAMIIMESHALGVSWQEHQGGMFRFYTQDSNVLAFICCLVCAVCGVKSLIRGVKIPAWTRHLRFYAASCMTLTLLVASCLLVPSDPNRTFASFMLEGKYLYLHTVCPLVMLALFYLHPGPQFREKHALLALVPTLIYGTILLSMNTGGAISGPYPFLRVREQAGYVTTAGCITVLAFAYTSARLLAVSSGIAGKKHRPLRNRMRPDEENQTGTFES